MRSGNAPEAPSAPDRMSFRADTRADTGAQSWGTVRPVLYNA
ncbi:hypothetical protein [Citricoccus sp.]|nr:hypothetical protein [Citricoccus sp.]